MNGIQLKNKQNRQNRKLPHSKRNFSHKRIESFDNFFQDLMANKNNKYITIKSPHLDDRLTQFNSGLPDKYQSALNTPQNRTLKHLQRRKYIEIKERIGNSLQELENKGLENLRDVFEYKQIVLNDFLNEFTDEIERECKQKGQILKFIWNSMFQMIEHISEQLAKKMQKNEAQQLKKQLQNHKIYQGLIEGYRAKQLNLNSKYQLEKQTMKKLVYELRFKRKQINKLYRNQKILLNKLNQVKEDSLNVQSSYIDLMSSFRDIPPESVSQLLKAREQISKSKQAKCKIQGTKKNNRSQISNEMANSKADQQIEALFEQIKQIVIDDKNVHISTLIEAAIQNFGLKHDDLKKNDHKIMEVVQNMAKVDAQTQITEFSFKNPHREDQSTQLSYHQRLKAEFIKNTFTQTFCQYGKKKILIERSVQIQQAHFKRRYVQYKFTVSKVFEHNFLFGKRETGSGTNGHMLHRKHYSQLNHNRYPETQIAFIDSIQSQNQDIKEVQVLELAGQKEKLKNQINFRRSSKQKDRKGTKKQSASYLNINKKYSSISSAQSIKNIKSQKEESVRNRQSHKTQGLLLGNPAPVSRFNAAENVSNPKPGPKILPAASSNSSASRSSATAAILFNRYTQLREDFSRFHFLEKTNFFNLEINEEKQKVIKNFFGKKNLTYLDLEQDDEIAQDLDIQQQMIAENLDHIDTIPVVTSVRTSANKISYSSPPKSPHQKRGSININYNDENNLLMNLCKNSYYKNKKKIKERVSLLKYKDQFTSVKDNIEMISKDVKDLLLHKQNQLRNSINNKNIKNTYKVLMMTFAKAYDCYNKGVLLTNLVYPLYESFSLVYGAINSTQLYKKMINFIACLSVNADNVILKFFLFFLGLDAKSLYSEKVTISEVYLCLTLLQKISVDGKVTLNIESLYTDINKIKEQLGDILYSVQLSDVCQSEAHLKINIYSIILLIVQEVIKCKNALRQSFIPIFNCCQQFTESKKIPLSLLQIILSVWRQKFNQPVKVQKLLTTVKKINNCPRLTVEQFCSILFENNIINLSQLLECFHVYNGKWKIPRLFSEQLFAKKGSKLFANTFQQFQIDLFVKLSQPQAQQEFQAGLNIQRMKKIIFIRLYQKKVDKVLKHMIGDSFQCLGSFQTKPPTDL